ncbi:MAG: sulfite exporter TauE/SafE family protein [Sulfurimonas sp.]|uniref:nickel/cobalt transporter n=1 Tax=Sulfurimonas sp. TaxID=2022749 RepID=UPI0025E07D46|nr:sulfite exporter TauE/SafE family protein [Sulfurimonas sp.]MCK9492170.1 sulfite exporter TauE/SafE family protein [Sulfurimonas sp.]
MNFYSEFLHKIVNWQYHLNDSVASYINSVNENGLSAVMVVLAISFIYGLVHAAGPGHGKALVSFYFLSRGGSYKEAIKLGYLISIVHALSALSITFVIYFILKGLFSRTFQELSNISMIISAGMILAVGIYLLVKAIKAKKEKEQTDFSNEKSQYAVAFSVGIVPCPGVMSIVLFCISTDNLYLGVLSAIVMSLGMGFTISLAGILTSYASSKSGSFLKTKGYLLEMFGAIFIILLGVFLFTINIQSLFAPQDAAPMF